MFLSVVMGVYNSNVVFGVVLGGWLFENMVFYGSIVMDSDVENVIGGVGLIVSF